MTAAKQFHYELEHYFPDVERPSFFDFFLHHEAWSASDLLPGEIRVLEPGQGHPLGAGAVRSVTTGSMVITEDVVGFRDGEYFHYEARDGAMPVANFGGELTLQVLPGGLLARYRGGFDQQYPGTGRILRQVFRLVQGATFRRLGRAYAQQARAGRQPHLVAAG